MISHLFLVRLCWLLLQKGGPGWVADRLGDLLPTLYAADGRGRLFSAWTTVWWIKRIHRCAQQPTLEEFLAANPELLDPSLGARENYA